MAYLVHALVSFALWYFGFMFLVAPLIVRFIQRMAARPRFEPMEWDRVLPEAQRYLAENGQALMALGFQPAAYLYGSGLTENVLPLLVISVNPQSGDKAMTSIIYAGTSGVMKLKARYVEFTTWYADGSSVDTNNNGSLGTFVADPKHSTYRFPLITDVAQLFSLHKRLSGSFEDILRGDWPPAVAPEGFTHRTTVSGTMKVLPKRGEEAEDLAEVMTDGYKRQCRLGRLYHDNRADAYRPTLRGAYVMTWGLIWPVSVLRLAMRRHQAARLLRTLDSRVLTSA